MTTNILVFLLLIFADIGLSCGTYFSDMFSPGKLTDDENSVNGPFGRDYPF